MTRSLRKPPFVIPALLRRLSKKRPIELRTRNSIILPRFVAKVFLIHQGKKWVRHKITEENVGSKFGDYARTRKTNIYKKKQKKK